MSSLSNPFAAARALLRRASAAVGRTRGRPQTGVVRSPAARPTEPDTAQYRAVERELQRRLRETLLLNRVIAAASSSPDPQRVLQTMCEELAHALDLPQAAVALLDSGRTHLTVVAEYQAPGRPTALGTIIPLANNAATQYVLDEQRGLVVPDAQTDPRLPDFHAVAQARGTVTLLIVPVLSRNGVLGTLGLDAITRREFDPEEIRLAQNVAMAAGQALETAQLYVALQQELAEKKRGEATLRRQNEELNALHDTALGLIDHRDPTRLLETILARATALVGTPHGFLYVVEPGAQEMVVRAGTGLFVSQVGYRMKRGAGLSGRVWETGEPVSIADYQTWPTGQAELTDLGLHATVGIPLRSGATVMGVIGLAYVESGQQVDAEALALLTRFGQLASLALENTRLYAAARQEVAERRQAEVALQQANAQLTNWVHELEQRSQELALLNEMGDLLQVCGTAEEALGIVARFSRQLFPAESGALYLCDDSSGLLEATATWGDAPPAEPPFAPDDCWALRRGRPHLVQDVASGLVCRHVRVGRASGYLCVPLIVQGRALGILHLRSRPLGVPADPHGARLAETKQRLAVTLAEHAGLAIANLQLQATLRDQAIRDPLTGLFNRRYLEESLEREIHAATRHGQAIGVIMLDIDHFKLFNDTFGHAAGDALLRAVGGFLQTHTRGGDIACRYGGEEFAVILPAAPIAHACARAEQIWAEVKLLRVQHHGEPLGAITLSLGVAAFPEHGATAEALLDAADAALYRAKAAGRDRVAAAVSVSQAER